MGIKVNRQKAGLKAYTTFMGDGPDRSGCLLVFAHTRNEARAHSVAYGPWCESEYIDMVAIRAPTWDDYAFGDEPSSAHDNSDLPIEAEPFYRENVDNQCTQNPTYADKAKG